MARRLVAAAVGLAVLWLGAALGLAAPAMRPLPKPPTAEAEAQPPLVLRSWWLGRGLSLRLRLDRAAPYRVFTLDAPRRLVVDLEGTGMTEIDPAAVALPQGVTRLRAGEVLPGWSRLVLDLDRPLALESAELTRQPDGAMLKIALRRTNAAAFSATAGAPPGVWPAGAVPPPVLGPRGTGPLTVAIDPGHGGVDPGAVRGGVAEKDVTLAFARELADQLVAADGIRVLLTRETDVFVPLAERVARARAAGADLFLSLHTNAVEDPGVAGAIAFTRSERSSSRAAAARARIENRADSLAGFEDMAPTDPVRRVLSDIARRETDARSGQLSAALIAALAPEIRTAAPYPRQSANFQVLGAPDMPSVLLELGFLSNPEDRAEMTSPAWRARAARAIVRAIATWRKEA